MVDNKEIKLKIKGSYLQNGTEHKMDLAKLHVHSNGEINTVGTDGIGDFTIKGHFKSDGAVEFIKQYIGKHSVEYKGRLENREINGTWHVGGLSDLFKIKIKAKVWEGHYEQSGTKHDITCFFKIDEDDGDAFGIGHDSIGTSLWTGEVDDGKIRLVKQYIGKHQVVYTGSLAGKEFSGKWNVGAASGDFHLKRNSSK